jgi:hypothetical protein
VTGWEDGKKRRICLLEETDLIVGTGEYAENEKSLRKLSRRLLVTYFY